MTDKKYYIIADRKWSQQEITLEQFELMVKFIFELDVFTEDKLNIMMSGKPLEIVEIVNEIREKKALNTALAIMLIPAPKTLLERLRAFIGRLFGKPLAEFDEAKIENHAEALLKTSASVAMEILADFFTLNAGWVKTIGISLNLLMEIPKAEMNETPQPGGSQE